MLKKKRLNRCAGVVKARRPGKKFKPTLPPENTTPQHLAATARVLREALGARTFERFFERRGIEKWRVTLLSKSLAAGEPDEAVAKILCMKSENELQPV